MEGCRSALSAVSLPFTFELLLWGSGYGTLQLRTCCMSISSFSELLENYWHYCFGYSFTYFIWRIITVQFTDYVAGVVRRLLMHVRYFDRM